MDSQQEIANMNAVEYKKYHESFMQNNHGSSAPHVFFCIYFTVLCSIYSSLILRNCRSNQYLHEYIIIVLPLIMVHTIWANYIYFLNFIITAIVLYEFYKQYPAYKSKANQLLYVKNKKVYSISMLRGLTYIITVFAILAVDFRDFPRRLAKTERYGYSLMDTGVGLFVLMSGLVHKDLRQHSFKDIIKGNLKFISILVFLGLVRYLSVKQLEYQEHVTEYGVHWNFFFTIAVCKLLSTVILYFNINILLCSFILLFIHEGILLLGVQEWVFSNALRDNLLSANREGISSCLGYVSMYLYAAHIKNILTAYPALLEFTFFKYISTTNTVQVRLILESVSLWFMFYIVSYFRPISRTLANVSYCIFLEAILVTFITMLYFVKQALQDEKYSLQVPKIIDNVNSNGLSYFLIANLMTGAVNLSLRTLLATSTTMFVLLNVYMILALYFTVFLRKYGIKI